MAGSWSKARNRVDRAPAFLLHQHPWRETSLILDVFSRDKGRVSIAARGARRAGSPLRGVLLGFQPVLLSWFGSGEVKTLHTAEWQGGVPHLAGLPLMCGFYLNELLIRLLPRDDPHPQLFDAYLEAVVALSLSPRAGMHVVEPILRRAELALLAALGYGVSFTHDRAGHPLQSDYTYLWLSGSGFSRCQVGTPHSVIGSSLLAIGQGELSDAKVAQDAKSLMRLLFGELLGPGELHTRQLLRDLQSIYSAE
ncbi:DNA repair protein RecO [Burkholderiaceae bacterium DAT-1]|nr:DNA repair protein RecO [Burkholderiaceae bacterium DAT-1]